jgi:hypothetical protein
MRFIRSPWIALVIGALSGPANAQNTIPATWRVTPTHAIAVPSSIEIPIKAGTLSQFALRDPKGDGADVSAQYESPDGKILGTIFLYAPTRPDAGLTFLATDETILRRFGPTAKRVHDELVPVDGIASAGRRVVYTGKTDPKLSGDPDGRIYSTAAFIRAGEWIMKVRVSGPISRSDEIEKDLNSLVAGLKFDPKRKPFAQSPITVTECSPEADRPTISLTKLPVGEAIGFSTVLDPDVQDEAGNAIANPITPDIAAMCREGVEIVDGIATQSFRVTSPSNGPLKPRRVMLHGDAGMMLIAYEDMNHPEQYILSRHAIGRSFVFARTSALPSNAELKSLLYSPERQPAVIAITRDHLTGKTNINVDCNLVTEGCKDRPPEN